MTITAILKQGFYYARTCRSLWLFGFFVGLASGGGSGGAGGGNNGGGGGGGGLGALAGLAAVPMAPIIAIVALVVVAALVVILMRFISEGALIEGVARVHRGGTMTTGEGFRAGWMHWGVLLRIALLYFAAVVASLAVLVVPCVMAYRVGGVMAALLVCLPALVVAVPWFVTLYVLRAFASRIAVIENRRALDAVAKARLFLHGRLMHALRLIVATFIGSLAMGLLAVAVLLPVALVLIALVRAAFSVPVVIAICALLLLPIVYVLVAMLGTLRSSIWTIGYVTQVQA